MNTATIPAPVVNTAQRRIESRLETSIPGIFLTVATSHHSGHYRSSIDRVQIREGILTMKINAARFSDISPVAQRTIPTKRYSAKVMGAAHDAFVATIGDKLSDALLWAERF